MLLRSQPARCGSFSCAICTPLCVSAACVLHMSAALKVGGGVVGHSVLWWVLTVSVWPWTEMSCVHMLQAPALQISGLLKRMQQGTGAKGALRAAQAAAAAAAAAVGAPGATEKEKGAANGKGAASGKGAAGGKQGTAGSARGKQASRNKSKTDQVRLHLHCALNSAHAHTRSTHTHTHITHTHTGGQA
jgi:hypothetical protein